MKSQVLYNIMRICNYGVYNHCERVGDFVKEHCPIQDEKIKSALIHAAYVHDIGKIFGPDIGGIPERLDDQWNEAKRIHAFIGAQFFKDADDLIYIFILNHHKKYDEYKNLYEKDIVEAITFLRFADIYDAVSHKRRYKNSYSTKNVYKILSEYEEFQEYLKEGFI